ncbi:MAG: glycosyltransferase family 4 protein [Candidatus Methylomirabilales bacterium]
MRIAINALTITPGISISAQVYLTNLLDALQRNDPINEYILVAAPWNAYLFPHPSGNLAVVVVPWRRGRVRRVVLEQAALPSILREERADVYYAVQGNALPLQLPCPSILNIHYMQNFSFPESLPWVRRLCLGVMMRHAARKASRIICGSQSVKAEIIRYLGVPPEKVRVVYHGIAKIFLDERHEASEGFVATLGIKKPYVLSIGNALPHKNLGRLIQAYVQVKHWGSFPHQLVIVGEARIRETLSTDLAGVPLPLREQIIFTGYLENRHLPSLYRSADLFVFPSYCESFGIPLLEAMASGTPIVTSNIQAMPEITGGAAYLVNPFDSMDLALGMLRVLTEAELREELIYKGQARIRDFSWDQTAQETVKVFEEIARLSDAG